MRGRLKFLICATAAVSALAGVAFATDTTGSFGNVVIASGTVVRDINASGNLLIPDMEEEFSSHLATDGASNVITQEVFFVPGGTTGWHSHPGILLLTLAADSGSVDWYDSRCGKTVYNAGDSWTEGTKLHDVVNRSTTNAHFLITYVVAQGVGKRTDKPAPRCAAALGLN
jgi:quercetin dioxygenase-like cupin family protein